MDKESIANLIDEKYLYLIQWLENQDDKKWELD